MTRRPFVFLLGLAVALVSAAPLSAAAESPAELIAAVMAGDAARVETLLTAGVSPDANDERGLPALTLAATRGNAAVVKVLLSHGADVHAKNQGAGAFPVVWYAAAEGSPETLRLLLQAGAGLNERNAQGLTPLMAAAFFGNTETLQALLAAKADVEARDPKGDTALMWAAKGGRYAATRLLLDAGAQVDALGELKAPALMYAAQYGFDDVVALLIERGADPSRKSTPGLTALDLAKQNHRTLTIGLLENGGRQKPPVAVYLNLRQFLFPEAELEKVFLQVERKDDPRREAVRQLALHGEIKRARELLEAGREAWQVHPGYWNELAYFALQLGDLPAALAAFHKTLTFPDPGSRETLRTWKLMRALGEAPPAEVARKVLGVVVESGMGAGVLTAAAYADRSPRLFLSVGGGFFGEGIWTAEETKDDQEMVRLGQELLDGMLRSENRDLPKPGRVRFTVLTPGGSYEAEESFALLQRGHGRYAKLFAVCDQLIGELGKRLKTAPEKVKP